MEPKPKPLHNGMIQSQDVIQEVVQTPYIITYMGSTLTLMCNQLWVDRYRALTLYNAARYFAFLFSLPLYINVIYIKGV
jgi:hypothetical protein